MDNQHRTPSGEQVADSPIFKKVLGKAEDYVKKPLRIKKLLNDSYQKASQKKDIGQIAGEVWESLQVLFRLIGAAVGGRYHGIPTRVLLGGTAVLLYFMSPIDAIPDFIPVIGLLDDAALLAWFMSTIKDEMDRFAAWEAQQPSAEHHPLAAQPQATDLSGEPHDHPAPAAAYDHSVRALTTDGTREPSRTADRSGGDPGGNVR
jgi:uncharacterized membrane protein YkvA (DUF1232 family)